MANCTPEVTISKAELGSLTGADILRTFAGLAGAFVLIHGPRAKCKAPGKQPVRRAWQKRPESLADAAAWLERGGNVGLLTGELSAGLVCLDLDAGYPAFCERYPDLAGTLTVTRSTAPERAKLFFRVVGTLPASRKLGAVEVLATGRQAVIAGTHASGAELELAGCGLVSLTLDQIQSVWHDLTGEGLADDDQAASGPAIAPASLVSGHDQTDTPGHLPAGLVAAVKERWSSLAVFAYHGWTDQTKQERNRGRLELRLLGRGGLLVETDQAGGWYCHSERRGGDCIAAWAYCTRGPGWSARNREQFRAVVLEMAAAGGLAIDTGEDDQRRADMLTMIDRAEQWAASPVTWAGYGRTRATDRAVFLAGCDLIRQALLHGEGELAAPLPCRKLAGLTGRNFKTVSKSLERLRRRGALVLETGSKFVDAAVYRLGGPDTCKDWYTLGYGEVGEALSPTEAEYVPNSAPIAVGTIRELAGHIAFAARARIDPDQAGEDDPAGTIAPLGLEVQAASEAAGYEWQSMTEGAAAVGCSVRAYSLKCRTHAALGLGELERRGRSVFYRARANWRALLEGLAGRLTTFKRNLRRAKVIVGQQVSFFKRLTGMGPDESGLTRLADDLQCRYQRLKRRYDQAVTDLAGGGGHAGKQSLGLSGRTVAGKRTRIFANFDRGGL